MPAVWLVLGSAAFALTLSLSLVAACAVATVVAMSLPWLMAKLGRDPAFGSGPLATVLQDLLSLVIYFAIASAILGETSPVCHILLRTDRACSGKRTRLASVQAAAPVASTTAATRSGSSGFAAGAGVRRAAAVESAGVGL